MDTYLAVEQSSSTPTVVASADNLEDLLDALLAEFRWSSISELQIYERRGTLDLQPAISD